MERVFITGTNRGIGLELTRQILRRADTLVFAAARHPAGAHDLNALAAQYPDRLTVIPLEVTDENAVADAARLIAALTDGLDILINNAAINPPESAQTLDGINTATLLETLHVNTAAPLMIIKALRGLLQRGNNPRIINISSEMGSLAERTYGGDYAYCASKAALNMVTRGLAVDLRRATITVIALDPGWVQTDMGSPEADLTPEESALGILRVIDRLTHTDSGRFFRWNGSENPW
ncbi:MAG: SDR family oxidoreductase [Anaerolineae bacterium]|nr:SDR family oxidoreductase [Anaerolineae bacterium]